MNDKDRVLQRLGEEIARAKFTAPTAAILTVEKADVKRIGGYVTWPKCGVVKVREQGLHQIFFGGEGSGVGEYSGYGEERELGACVEVLRGAGAQVAIVDPGIGIDGHYAIFLLDDPMSLAKRLELVLGLGARKQNVGKARGLGIALMNGRDLRRAEVVLAPSGALVPN